MQLLSLARVPAPLLGALLLAAPGLAQNTPVELANLERSAEAALWVGDGDLVRVGFDRRPDGSTLAVIDLSGQTVTMQLEPYSVRHADYQLVAQLADGTYETMQSSAERTVRGRVDGLEGSLVAGSLLDDGLHARIELPGGDTYWLQPLSGLMTEALPSHHLLYRADEVLDVPGTCGADQLPPIIEDAGSTTTQAGGTGLKIAEVACDADFEYFTDWGGVTGVENRINFIINTLNIQYEGEVGITHVITTILVRTSAGAPYTSTSANTLLDQFQAQWNNNHTNIQRDVAHLFTGKSIDGGTIGIAYVGVICNQTFGYGLVESDFNSNDACATDLSAHELGHNWSAGHCSCTSNTMNPFITCANTFHPTFTIPTITNHRDSRACLADEPGDPSIALANSDSTSQGSVAAGNFQSTHTSNDGYEQLREERTGGNPARRRSRLTHVWTFNVPAAQNYSFSIEAHHTANSEGDDFDVAYSRDGSGYTTMLTVTKTSDNDSAQTYAFTEDVSGTLFVRVTDQDQTQGNSVQDSLFVDHMFVMVDSNGDTTPPAAPTGVSASPGNGSVTLDWADNGEPDLDGYTVYRSTTSGGSYSAITGVIGVSGHVDNTVTNGTTYYYVVTASDLTGNESGNSNEVVATPSAGGGPTTLHVSSITVSTVNVGQGNKIGRAVVVIVDNQGNPVSGANVAGSFTGDYNESANGVTNASGAATLDTVGTNKGGTSYTFCVDGVTHGSLSYAPGDNVVDCANF